MRPRRLRKSTKAATLRRRAAFYVLVQGQEPDEHFVDPAARQYDEMLAALPPLPPHRAARFRDQLEPRPTRPPHPGLVAPARRERVAAVA